MSQATATIDRSAPIDLAREPDFALDQVRVRPALCEVVFSDRTVRLQRRVMQVLVAMTQAAGEVVSRDEFANRCWGGLAVGEDALNRCVGQLRRLIDESASALAIETLPGVGYRLAPLPRPRESAPTSPNARPRVAVLPFANMSGDPEQEYFSDGITEDVITDLSKVSSLFVLARHTAFALKGKAIDLLELVAELGVTHVLEGSVRKAGRRVRITAQLVDGETGGHIWADRWDRDLDDIFALQDEISRAIVGALQVKLLPEEARAIERRGTDNPEAYKTFLLARSQVQRMSRRRRKLVENLCRRAISLDPNYALAWALLARCIAGRGDDSDATQEAWAAADRALELDPNLAEAHAARGRLLTRAGRYEEAAPEIDRSLQLDPLSADANRCAGSWAKGMRRYADASRYLEVAGRLDPHDMISLTMAAECRLAIEDVTGARALARQAVSRAEAAIAIDPDDGLAMAEAVGALVVLGEMDRAREWAEHAKLLEPGDVRLRYNMCCAMARAGEVGYALQLLDEALSQSGPDIVRWARVDNGLDALRAEPRFSEIVAKAEARWFSDRDPS